MAVHCKAQPLFPTHQGRSEYRSYVLICVHPEVAELTPFAAERDMQIQSQSGFRGIGGECNAFIASGTYSFPQNEYGG